VPFPVSKAGSNNNKLCLQNAVYYEVSEVVVGESTMKADERVLVLDQNCLRLLIVNFYCELTIQQSIIL